MQITMLLMLVIGLSSLAVSQDLRPDFSREPASHEPGKPFPLTLIVSPGGFTKRSVTVDAGTYELRVIDRTGGKRFQVQLDLVSNARAENGSKIETNKLAVGPIPAKRDKFTTLQTLTPGIYKVSIADSPQWICTITVK